MHAICSVNITIFTVKPKSDIGILGKENEAGLCKDTDMGNYLTPFPYSHYTRCKQKYGPAVFTIKHNIEESEKAQSTAGVKRVSVFPLCTSAL
jgi:hypothetical protein